MSVALLAAVAAAAGPPAPVAAPAPPSPIEALAQPAQVRLTGTTTADPTLARDVVTEMRRYAAYALKCGEVGAVAVSLQPAGWQPADPNFRVGPAGTHYEKWAATMCGQTRLFLIGFWAAGDGGTLFQVGYPFPPEPDARAPAH